MSFAGIPQPKEHLIVKTHTLSRHLVVLARPIPNNHKYTPLQATGPTSGTYVVKE